MTALKLHSPKKPRATKCIIHFNKNRAKDGFPWTVHNRGRCIPASHVHILTDMISSEKPKNKTNPRYFFTCVGFVDIDKHSVVTITKREATHGQN